MRFANKSLVSVYAFQLLFNYSQYVSHRYVKKNM